jgi:16S rRNA (cytidine1402-2'-O)-methyltransferase
MAGTLYVVATPIGNLEDITIRALRVLREVAVIAAEDTRRTGGLLARHDITTPATSLHEHNERTKTSALVRRLLAGDSIALVSDAGTPTVADPGQHLIAAAVDAGVKVEPIPGPNAAVAALSVSAVPSATFTFLGFPPTRSKERRRWFERLRGVEDTAVFYEAPHRILRTLEEVALELGNIPALVARELTKTHETLVRGPINEIVRAIQAPRGEFTVVLNIGHKTEYVEPGVVWPGNQTSIANDFSHLTNYSGCTRRQAISALARKYGCSAREIYSAIETAKSSGG